MSIFKKKNGDEELATETAEAKRQCELDASEGKRDVEYVWVDGFKGTEADMTCRGFQFEFGQSYMVDDPVLCEHGFHLCLKLNDVFKYYAPTLGHRFFKVKALVKREHLDEYGKTKFSHDLWRSDRVDKLVAKEIEFVEEISRSDLLEYYKGQYEWIDDVGELNALVNEAAYEAFANNKASALLDGRYSRTFSMMILGIGVPKRQLVNRMVALADEGVSPDMRAYLLLTSQF